ncbi:MAG: WhiB family transcriptional regulator [Acidimicrobiales bacterium]
MRDPQTCGAQSETWQDRAECKGQQSSMFYPPMSFERRDVKLAREATAKAICERCPVRRDCLDYAIQIREPHGIWGGLSEGERRALIARQARRTG